MDDRSRFSDDLVEGFVKVCNGGIGKCLFNLRIAILINARLNKDNLEPCPLKTLNRLMKSRIKVGVV